MRKTVEQEESQLQPARLKSLIIRNFRCIGSEPVEIELDQIVVLVGPNNAGKSSILKAYELVMNEGGKASHLAPEDFPGETFNPEQPPEVELQTYVTTQPPGANWIITDTDGQQYVRERWTWAGVGAPIRQGFDPASGEWVNKVPWGAANVANSRRPLPHRIEPFDSPDAHCNAISDLLRDALKERAEFSEDGSPTTLSRLREAVVDAQTKLVDELTGEIKDMEAALGEIIGEVFSGFVVEVDARPDADVDKAVQLFKSGPLIRMGPRDGHLAPATRQGSGAQRTLLWAALKVISERKTRPMGKQARAHVLLLDEPEICLHPNAIREASRVLYDLPTRAGWQVMLTTHSPAFIDLSRDNTTIVRVSRSGTGAVRSTTVFRPTRVNLSDDERELLKLLNLCDPHVAEFFFDGRTVLVEGDTEYTAFRYLAAQDPRTFGDLHIVRARGKATLCSLAKILNQFGARYGILHDSDTPMIATSSGATKKNPAWTLNERIATEAAPAIADGRARVIACITNFETAIFGESYSTEKPYNAFSRLQGSTEATERVTSLVKALVDFASPLPENTFQWSTLPELENRVTAGLGR